MLRVTFAFKMAPSNLKIKESIIEFYKLHSKKSHDIVIRMFENMKGRIHLAKESGDGLSSLIKF